MYKKVCLPLNQFRKAEKIEGSKDENSDKSAILFDVEKRIIFISEEIYEDDGILFEQAVELISDYIPEDADSEYVPEPLTKLEIHINSDGGSVTAGLNIISQIEDLKKNGVEVVTFVKEKACSMAFLIAIAGSYRKARKYAKLMLHPSWYLLSKETPLTISTLRDFIKDSDKSWMIFEEFVLSCTRFTKKQLKHIYKSCDDYVMDTKEALEKSCIDEIV